MKDPQNVVAIVGPPGTGKTSELSRLAEQREQPVVIASLTKAAAATIPTRAPRHHVGTLHAHCFHALYEPTIVTNKHLPEWNEQYPTFHLSRITDDYSGEDDSMGGETSGDRCHAQHELYRHRMTPRAEWDLNTTNFAKHWDEWKAERGFFDFTDLLEVALHSTDHAPGNPSAMIFDEAQDFSRLEWAVVQHWAKSLESVAFAGDPDQCLYSWRGADPTGMLTYPGSKRYVLPQSYRIPAKVHAMSQAWIRRIEGREEQEFRPRDEVGRIRKLHHWNTRQDAPHILRDVEQTLAAGKSVMVLASCDYLLTPIIMEAKKRGLPFENPYRRKNRFWNPLYVTGKRTSAAQRIAAYLKPEIQGAMWTGADLKRWAATVRTECFVGGDDRSIRDMISKLDDTAAIPLSWMNAHIGPEWDALVDCNLDAYERALLYSEWKRFLYPLAIARKQGGTALTEQPKLCFSTCHGVKGGEADVVYLSPEISPAMAQMWRRDPNPTIRTMYVGMTRAREELVILGAHARRDSLNALSNLASEYRDN